MGSVGDAVSGAVDSVVDSATQLIQDPAHANIGDVANVIAPGVSQGTEYVLEHPDQVIGAIGTVAPGLAPAFGGIMNQVKDALPSLPKLPDVSAPAAVKDTFKDALELIQKVRDLDAPKLSVPLGGGRAQDGADDKFLVVPSSIPAPTASSPVAGRDLLLIGGAVVALLAVAAFLFRASSK